MWHNGTCQEGKEEKGIKRSLARKKGCQHGQDRQTEPISTFVPDRWCRDLSAYSHKIGLEGAGRKYPSNVPPES